MNHILLVASSRESALHLSRLVTRNLDAELYQAGSGSEALELVQRKPVDLVVVDVQLPQINGFDICSQLHEKEASQHVPVLLLTSLEGEFYPEVKALSMGPGEIYTLPTPGSNLMAWIKILLKITSTQAAYSRDAGSFPSSESDIYKLLLDKVDDALLWVEASSGKIQYANAAIESVTGYPPDILCGKTIWELAPMDHQENVRKIWLETCERKTERVVEIPIVRRSGMHATVIASLLPQRFEDREGVIVALRDLSERTAQSGDFFADALGDVGEFLAALGHEVRNPLTGISTNVQYMEMTYADTETQKEIYRDIMAAVKRLDLMFREISDYIRPMELKPSQSDLNQLLNEALAEHEEMISGRKRIEVVKQLDSALPEVDVDAARFHRALSLLVEHCANAANEEGRITLNTQAAPEAISLAVSHDGKPLSAQRLKQLFQPLPSLKSAESGMGLAYAKRIFDEHNCHLEVESEHGRGSTFTVKFPLRVRSSSRESE